MLLAVELSQWLPWTVLAIALAALGALIARFVVMYRQMKREQSERKAAYAKQDATFASDGEYFVMSAFSLYRVGQGKQLCCGDYLLKTDGQISLQINGVVVDCSDGEVLTLADGDEIRCERDLRVKPITKKE